MESKLDEIKESEKKTYEKLRNDEVERVNLELRIKDQELKNIMRTQEFDNENSKNLKMVRKNHCSLTKCIVCFRKSSNLYGMNAYWIQY